MKLFMIQINPATQEIKRLDENLYNDNIRRDDDNGNSFFLTKAHFRAGNGGFYIPAFQMQSGNYTITIGIDKDSVLKILHYDSKTGLYFNSEFGATDDGMFYINVLENDRLVETHKLFIAPSSITHAEYSAMIREIIAIYRELLTKTVRSQQIRIGNNWLNNLNELNCRVDEIFQLLQKINQNPRYDLKPTQKFCNASQIRKFDNKIFQQYFTIPNRHKYLVPTSEISYDIFEHRLIYHELTRLKEFIREQNLQQQSKFDNLQRNLSNEQQNLNQKAIQIQDKQFLNQWQKYIDRREVPNFDSTLAQQLESKLDLCLSLKLFKNIKPQPEQRHMTQIFTNDENYHSVYEKLRELDEDFYFTVEEQILIREKIYKVYEYWILARIVEHLVINLNWQVDGGDNPVQIFRDFLNARKKFGRDVAFKFKRDNMKLEIYYDAPVENSNLRPDYLFKVTMANNAPKYFILDAKYRNYSEQGDNKWLNDDLQGVCIDKYIDRLERETGNEILMSFIVHSDKTRSDNKFLGKYVTYNGTIEHKINGIDGSKRQFGSFYLLPDVEDDILNQSNENLTLYFQMMFEYFMEQWQTCWRCGSNDVDCPERETKGGKVKYHLKCRNCGAFWVKTHCHTCDNKLILKHHVNYHVEEISGRNWYVFCPKCGK